MDAFAVGARLAGEDGFTDVFAGKPGSYGIGDFTDAFAGKPCSYSSTSPRITSAQKPT